jgi:hypothetical protein
MLLPLDYNIQNQELKEECIVYTRKDNIDNYMAFDHKTSEYNILMDGNYLIKFKRKKPVYAMLFKKGDKVKDVEFIISQYCSAEIYKKVIEE